MEDFHMYKKCGRHDIEAEYANNEEQFAIRLFNFMRKHLDIIISQLSIPQINLDISTAMPRVVLAMSSVSSAPDHQKYPMDDINEPTPCTLLYVKGRTLTTIKVADAIVMATCIMHGRPVLSECAVVKVTTISVDHEFEDLDDPDEEEGIEKLEDANVNFILWSRKDIILKTHSTPIVLPHSKDNEGTPASQNTISSTAGFTPPSQNPPQPTPSPENQPSTQLLSINLLHMVILQSLLLTLPLLKVHQLNKLLSIILLHMVILQSLLLTLPLLQIPQLNKLLSIIVL
jgi:hypothetical protein